MANVCIVRHQEETYRGKSNEWNLYQGKISSS